MNQTVYLNEFFFLSFPFSVYIHWYFKVKFLFGTLESERVNLCCKNWNKIWAV